MALLTIRIKKKSPQGKFTKVFQELFPLPAKKIAIHKNYGIITACSSNLFIGLQMLISSVAHFYDIETLVWDVGMTPEQVSWCCRQPRVKVKPFKFLSFRSHIQYPGAWFKPYYINASPFKHSIWIDADAMVIGDLREIIDLSHPRAFFTSDHTQVQETTINNPVLYSYMPIGKHYYHDILPYLNSGVMVVNRKRDAVLLQDWQYCVDQACSVKEVADAISCWDQGALKWALHKNDLLYLITPDKKFNFPAKIRHFSYRSTPESVIHWFNSIKPNESCVITHWMGSPKPWANWGRILDLDLTFP